MVGVYLRERREAKSKERQKKSDELNAKAYRVLKGLDDRMIEILARFDEWDAAVTK